MVSPSDSIRIPSPVLLQFASRNPQRLFRKINGRLPSELLFLKLLSLNLATVHNLSYLSLKISISIDLISGAAMPGHRANPCGSGAKEMRLGLLDHDQP